ncbi:hypothetical protein [Paraburkholderia flava]|uniref:hypothetical protein n=1 Tax=Paraburkholderia flava TaxID=2547393 RepID=UPI00105EFA9F|nr:hypothetical protein [Paraburkholderia flava]
MTKKVKNNPAARLHEILKGIHAINQQKVCRQAWSELLHTSSEEELLSRLSKLIVLAGDVSEATNRLFPVHLTHMRTLEVQLRDGIVKQNLNGQWQTFISNVSAVSLVHLSMVETMLNERESMQPPTTLNELNETFAEARTKIIDADDIPDDVKLVIMRYLNRITTSLDEYFITGIFPVVDALNCAMGNVVVDAEYREAIEKTDAGGFFGKAIASAAATVNVATGIVNLLGSEPFKAIVKYLTKS